MAPTVRLALVDDHELFRHSLAADLRERGFTVVGEAGDARAGLTLIDRERPDVVLLDVEMPGVDGLMAARELIGHPPAPKILMVSAHGNPWLVTAALEAGADGYALKSRSIDELVS